ncbi:MAG: type III pantothenate kinase [Pseudomonadota bacterium]
MLLAIDVGNTNTVFAVHDDEAFAATWRIRTEGRRTADEYFVWLSQLMNHAGVPRQAITGVVIASVAPETLFNLRRLAMDYFALAPLIVGEPGVDFGVEVRTARPAEVGADRVVNALAAYRRYGPDLIVVDFGTATTFDVIDHDGAYAGGVIAPGVNLSSEALFQATSKLPRIDVAKPPQVVGLDTVPAMQSGLFWGYVGLIEGICARVKAERARPMTVIATGGLSALFAQGAEMIDHVDEDLTLRGLVEIHRRNVGRPERRPNNNGSFVDERPSRKD